MSKPLKPDTLTLNNGAMRLLPVLLNDCPVTKPLHIVALGTLQEQAFLVLPVPPESKAVDRLTAIEEAKRWQRKGAHQVPVTAVQREALRALFSDALQRGIVPAGPASLCWVQQLGLGEGA